ncbi:Hypothetical protein LUCI_4625 [Lucifera butyrica]|uniref:Uncharacterized protein n=1 Tax=Lucifera butyrica TaxID=1351585 RepID=A0A498REB0_9FIRM|nr:hypothetical protein [Lucifera butyrica]VBB09335.1 Hypothetical protein LUCI_4625 [Lucifera butyrica]
MISTVLTSLIVSLIVSIFTFTIGLRAGKNQADRPKLKEIYRMLAVHFVELQKGIAEGCPKKWEDYLFDKGEYYTTVERMIKDGSLIDLPPKLMLRLEKLEQEILYFGYKHNQIAKEMSRFTFEYLQKYVSNPIEESKYIIRYGTLKSSRGLAIGILLTEDGVKDFISNFNDNNVGISFRVFNDREEKEIYVYPDGLSISIADFVEKLSLSIREQPSVSTLLNERPMLQRQVSNIINILERRTNDPHPFWQTILTAFHDVLKG